MKKQQKQQISFELDAEDAARIQRQSHELDEAALKRVSGGAKFAAMNSPFI